jgi:hypothetical protein
MATYTATEAASGAPAAGHGFAGSLKKAKGSITLTANTVAADVLEFCRVPKGAVILGGRVTGSKVEVSTSGATFDMDIGTATDPDQFGNFGVWSAAAVAGVKPEVGYWMPLGGTLLAQGGGPQTMTAETVIIGTVVASSTNFTTGGAILTVEVDYVLP